MVKKHNMMFINKYKLVIVGIFSYTRMVHCAGFLRYYRTTSLQICHHCSDSQNYQSLYTIFNKKWIDLKSKEAAKQTDVLTSFVPTFEFLGAFGSHGPHFHRVWIRIKHWFRPVCRSGQTQRDNSRGNEKSQLVEWSWPVYNESVTWSLHISPFIPL